MIESDLRNRILAEPESVLEDRDVMKALVGANERHMGGNVVDLRGIAMEQLENRLDRLEDTHRAVIAAAYENVSGTNQVHRAVLQLLEAADFRDFLRTLGADVAATLRIDCIRLVLETRRDGATADLGEANGVLHIVQPGIIADYVAQGAGTGRSITLRAAGAGADEFHGAGTRIRSEALLLLDLGAGRRPGLLLLGSGEKERFQPSQASDLLAFLAGAFERMMRRWLS